MFVAHARAPVHTYARPSRRFPHRAFEIPGRSYQPRAIARPHLLIAIDTSASMSDAELVRVAAELREMQSHARLTIAEVDTKVQRTYPFQGSLPSVKGRGGTDLRPALDESFLRSRFVDGVVYFTDGDGPTSAVAPSVPVLWVLTKHHEDFPCPFGVRAFL
jgi:predicted metal-dependent peptidase